MSAISQVPETLNFLSPLNYKFKILNLPSVNFFTQRINIPGVSIPPANFPNPFSTIPYSGDIVTFEELSVTFKVDEKMQNWKEIYTWLMKLGFPEDWDQYASLENEPLWTGTGLKSDISVLILDSSHNPFLECIIKDAFPISLSEFQMGSTDNDVNYITCSSVFKYTNYTIKADSL